MADRAADVVVVGAGIVGCAVAYYLSLEPWNVIAGISGLDD